MTAPALPERPTAHWRRERADEARSLAAGEITPKDAFLAELFPDAFLDPCDALLATFEAALPPSNHDAAFSAVQALVVGLNKLNDDGGEAYIETDERERLCAYIEECLSAAGVDVAAMTASRGIGVGELTDEWRQW